MARRSPLAEAIRSDGAKVHFDFSESSGAAVDSISGVVLNAGGGMQRRLFPPPATDRMMGIGYGMRFYTTGGLYHTDSNALASREDYSMTIEWVMAVQESVPAYQGVVHRLGCYSVFLVNNTIYANVISRLGNNTAFSWPGLTPLFGAGYNHYVLTHDGSHLKLYVNGAERHRESGGFISGFARNKGTSVGVILAENGWPNNNTQWKNGRLSELAIYYGVALSLNQIQNHHYLARQPTHKPTSGIDSSFNFNITIESVNKNMEGDAKLGLTPFLDSEMSEITRGQAWWDNSYPYRRVLEYTAPPTGAPKGHPMHLAMSPDIVEQGKTLPDLEDLEIAYLSGIAPQRWVHIPSNAEIDNNDVGGFDSKGTIKVQFRLEEDLGPGEVSNMRYFLYYGIKDIFSINAPYLDYDRWPLKIDPSSDAIDYTNPGQDWIDGSSSKPFAKLAFSFYGDRAKLVATVGPNKGIAELQINDGEWNLVDLYDLEEKDAEVFRVEDLPSGLNYLRYRVSGQSNPSSIGLEVNFTSIDYSKHSVFFDAGEEVDSSRTWSSTLGGMING